MALLITLAVITLLVVTTMELNRRARATVISTAAVRDRHRLSEMLASGVNVAMAMLVEDKKNTTADSIQEDWADPEKVKSLLESIPFDEGKLEVSISDELSRIQVNALVKFPDSHTFNEKQVGLWDRFLKLAFLAYEPPDEIDPANTIINSLKDWLDSGDDDAITGLTGAESDYYLDLDPPYSIRNGPLTHLNELLLVKGSYPGTVLRHRGITGYFQLSDRIRYDRCGRCRFHLRRQDQHQHGRDTGAHGASAGGKPGPGGGDQRFSPRQIRRYL